MKDTTSSFPTILIGLILKVYEVQVKAENGFPDMPIHQCSTNKKPSNIFELEVCTLHFCNTKGLLRKRSGRRWVSGDVP